MAYYKISINHVDFGVFCADSKSEALDACAREAGYGDQADYEYYLLDNAAQAAGYRDWDDWGAAGPETQRPDPKEILDNEYDIIEIMPDGPVYAYDDPDSCGIYVGVESGDVSAVGWRDVVDYGPATPENVKKAVRDTIQAQLGWAREWEDDHENWVGYNGPNVEELQRRWEALFPEEEM